MDADLIIVGGEISIDAGPNELQQEPAQAIAIVDIQQMPVVGDDLHGVVDDGIATHLKGARDLVPDVARNARFGDL